MDLQSIFNLIVTTLIPLVFMGWYIYKKDEYKPEPLRALFVTFFVGAFFGLLASICTKVGYGLPEIYGMNTDSVATYMESKETRDLIIGYFALTTKNLVIGDLFLIGGLIFVFLFNHFFDEQVDGIVYSVFVAMGFIFCQNVIFLLYKDFTIFDTETLRALFIIPIYFFYAILCGYYLSRIRYRRPRWNWLLAYDLVCFLLVPFIFQVLLTVLLLVCDLKLPIWVALLICLVIMYACFFCMHYALQRIESHLARDQKEGRVKNDRIGVSNGSIS